MRGENKKMAKKKKKLTLAQRVARIEDWIDFWESVPTPWKITKKPKKRTK